MQLNNETTVFELWYTHTHTHTSGTGEERVEEGGVCIPGEQEEGPYKERENQIESVTRKMGQNHKNK